VNPLVAVLLGVLFAGEQMSWLQIMGLGVILASVLLINLSKYRQRKAIAAEVTTVKAEVTTVKTERKLAVTGAGNPAVCPD
jgi:EamA domain-containing membrane protein RarD